MNYLTHIKFNNEVIELYKNSDWDYKQKIYILLRENIEFYSQINALKRIKRVKPIKDKQKENKSFIWLNSRVKKSMFQNPFVSDITEEEKELEVELGFTLHKNN